MKKLLSLCLLLTLSGCLGNFTNSGLSSSMSTALVGGVTTAATGNPLLGMAIGASAGVATDALVVEPDKDANLSQLNEADRASYLKHQTIVDAVENISGWVIAATLAGVTVIPAVVGYYLPNNRQRKLEKLAFDNPEIKCEHLSK